MKHFEWGKEKNKVEASFTKAKGDQLVVDNFMYIL